MMKKFKKIGSILFDILLFLIFALAACVTIVSLSISDNGVPSVNGYIPLSIQSNSMKDYIKKGDLIITKKVDADSLKTGDVIAFFATEKETTIIKTHRIIEINEINGIKVFTTKGDAVDTNDNVSVGESDIISVYTGKKIPILGAIMSFMQSQIGFLICIIIPLFCIFVYQMYKFIGDVIENKKKELQKKAKTAE